MKDFQKFLNLYSFLTISILFLIIASLVDISLRQQNYDRKIKDPPFKFEVEFYPILKTNFPVDITAKSAIVIDKESSVVLFSKNPDLLFSMASTTKIMTALVGLDFYKMGDILKIKSDTVDGVNVGFKNGQKFKFIDLLYAMLLPSGNDAALAIAQNFPQGEVAFIEKMNEYAKKLDLSNTNFADPSGLADKQGYTTASDLAKLASFAIGNNAFARVVATEEYTFSDIGGKNTYKVFNLNKLLGINGVNGIKTGYTDEAGQVLVTSKLEGNRLFIIVVLGSEDRFSDTEKLLSLVSNNISYLPIHP